MRRSQAAQRTWLRLVAPVNVAALFLASATIAGAQVRYAYDVVYRSPAPGGVQPKASLIEGADGNLYGTTSAGGASNHGTIFKVTPAGTVTILHELSGPTDGQYPATALIQATDGNFYGTTEYGGAPLGGTAFKITPEGAFTILHAFPMLSYGRPTGLIQAKDGNFYGRTRPLSGYSTIFRMSPEGAITILTIGSIRAGFRVNIRPAIGHTPQAHG